MPSKQAREAAKSLWQKRPSGMYADQFEKVGRMIDRHFQPLRDALERAVELCDQYALADNGDDWGAWDEWKQSAKEALSDGSAE